jgi:predicted secreted protein
MQRSKKILILCHCLLNSNAKVFPLALCGGVYRNVLQSYIDNDVGLVQLPCPETSYLGLNRWGMTREQYNHLNFKNFCRDLLKPSLCQIKAFVDAGCEILGVIGMDGSPNCGVNQTCGGFTGGEICSQLDIRRQQDILATLPGKGVFMEIFTEMLATENITLKFEAIDEAQAIQI